jgi:hypothetical protein
MTAKMQEKGKASKRTREALVLKVGASCHCEEPQATKQSLFQAKIASLRSQ